MTRRALAACAAAATLGASCLSTEPPAADMDGDADRAARSAAEAFLDRYVNDDGRVVRRDEGGDTVSEGQAYALLLAAAIGDEDRFALVSRWTAANLQRPDGLLAWHWADGRIVDAEPAADADLDAARALLLAADRFHERKYREEGVRIGNGILALETIETGAGRVLVAGPWARTPPITLNPSYVAPRSYRALHRAAIDGQWASLARTGREHVRALTADGLPPDWAHLDPADPATGVRAAPPPGGGEIGYGLDAARVPIRFAEDCASTGREVAAQLWPRLRNRDARHPLELVAAAAAADAAGEPDRRDALLASAEQRDRDHPTYYGAAWVALGRVLLTTDLAGRCDGVPAERPSSNAPLTCCLLLCPPQACSGSPGVEPTLLGEQRHELEPALGVHHLAERSLGVQNRQR